MAKSPTHREIDHSVNGGKLVARPVYRLAHVRDAPCIRELQYRDATFAQPIGQAPYDRLSLRGWHMTEHPHRVNQIELTLDTRQQIVAWEQLYVGKRCEQVVGVDVAESMLAEAARNCASLPNVKLLPGDDLLSRVEGKFDLI